MNELNSLPTEPLGKPLVVFLLFLRLNEGLPLIAQLVKNPPAMQETPV